MLFLLLAACNPLPRPSVPCEALTTFGAEQPGPDGRTGADALSELLDAHPMVLEGRALVPSPAEAFVGRVDSDDPDCPVEEHVFSSTGWHQAALGGGEVELYVSFHERPEQSSEVYEILVQVRGLAEGALGEVLGTTTGVRVDGSVTLEGPFPASAPLRVEARSDGTWLGDLLLEVGED